MAGFGSGDGSLLINPCCRVDSRETTLLWLVVDAVDSSVFVRWRWILENSLVDANSAICDSNDDWFPNDA